MTDYYADIGPRDFEVTGVAWQRPSNMVPIAPMTFETWIIAPDSPHGVRFIDAETADRYEGDASDVLALTWVDEKGELRITSRREPERLSVDPRIGRGRLRKGDA